MTVLAPVLVVVADGCVIHRHGRSWVAGERLHLAPDDADKLIRSGTVREVRR